MSQRGIDFANDWVGRHIHDEPYNLPEAMVDDTVQHLIADAQAAGLSIAEIEEDMGPVNDFIVSEYARRTEDEEAEVRRNSQVR